MPETGEGPVDRSRCVQCGGVNECPGHGTICTSCLDQAIARDRARPTDVDEAIHFLNHNAGQVVMSVGADAEDPVLWIYHDLREEPRCRIVSSALGGWSEGVVEPVCGAGDDFLREFLTGEYETTSRTVGRAARGTLVLVEQPFPDLRHPRSNQPGREGDGTDRMPSALPAAVDRAVAFVSATDLRYGTTGTGVLSLPGCRLVRMPLPHSAHGLAEVEFEATAGTLDLALIKSEITRMGALVLKVRRTDRG